MKKTIEISDLVKVESSNIDMVGFNEGTTYVQFKNGSIYSYPQTVKEDFTKLVEADSVGSHFSKTYRHMENYDKLEDTELVKDTKVEDIEAAAENALNFGAPDVLYDGETGEIMYSKTKCKDCGTFTTPGKGSARCPDCWEDRCGH